MTEHTKLPWKLKVCNLYAPGAVNRFMELIPAVNINSKTHRANCEFIVRACNAHNVLVKACEAAMGEFDAQCARNADPEGIIPLRQAIDEAKALNFCIEQLRTALDAKGTDHD